jgi:hypothetical protein
LEKAVFNSSNDEMTVGGASLLLAVRNNSNFGTGFVVGVYTSVGFM